MDVSPGVLQTNQFVEMLRNSASYISMHRGSIMVLHLPGDLIDTPAFEKTLDDIALMSLLGVKIVLVCGVAAQVRIIHSLHPHVHRRGKRRCQARLEGLMIEWGSCCLSTMVQVDHRLRSNSQVPRYCGDTRITDTETLRIVKEEAGFARCEVESSLSRGFKGTHAPTPPHFVPQPYWPHHTLFRTGVSGSFGLPAFRLPLQAVLV